MSERALTGIVGIAFGAALTIAGQSLYDGARWRAVQVEIARIDYDAEHGLNGCTKAARMNFCIGSDASWKPTDFWSNYWWEVPGKRLAALRSKDGERR